ncbi:MAG TPA: tetratricopeptide repeat protein [Acetobacteraceae bacterium]|nr:tetratricopeptide repeat protein [Acetobacteraceae bacterium]
MPNARPTALALSLISAALLGLPTISRAGPPDAFTGVYGDFLRARFATARSDSATAAEEYLRALEQAPGQADLLRQAFHASALSARPEATGLARLLPGERDAQLYLAARAAQAGDWRDVAARARTLPHDDLSEVLRPILLAWSEQAQGRSDAALAILRPAQGGPVRAIFVLHAGLIADIAGSEAQAAEDYQKAEAFFDVPNLRLAETLASFDARHGRPVEAARVLARAADGAPSIELALPALRAQASRPVVSNAAEGLAEAYLAAAASFRLSDRGDTSLLLLRLALDLRPDFTTARLLAADVLETRRHPEEARQLLDGIAAGDALAPLARLHRAALMQRDGNVEGAMAEMDALGRECPDSTLPLEQKAGLLQAAGHSAEAGVVLDQAIARLPAQPKASAWALFYARAVARDQDHDWAGSEADLLHALALSPEQPAVLNYLGYSWAERGVRLGEARRMLEKAVQLQPNDGAVVDSLGWAMLRQGDAEGAARLLERATELRPDDPTITGHLGDAYAAGGRRLEAEYQWRRALLLHPQDAEAARLRMKLDDTPRQSAQTDS